MKIRGNGNGTAEVSSDGSLVNLAVDGVDKTDVAYTIRLSLSPSLARELANELHRKANRAENGHADE